MKQILTVTLLFMSTQLFAVEGYQDIYLNREKAIQVHSILCGKNFNSVNGLKPAIVYTNTKHIEKGTYYFSSVYGDFSYTFNEVAGQDPKMILARGLLSGGKTKKEQMVQEFCLVGKLKGLSTGLSKKIETLTLEVEDPKWDSLMKQFSLYGKPAFAKGVYQSQRTNSSSNLKDKELKDKTSLSN